jgi:hypothetical protein
MNANIPDMQLIPGVTYIKASCTKFNTRPVIVGFVVDKIALVQGLFSATFFAYRYHPTGVPCSFIYNVFN